MRTFTKQLFPFIFILCSSLFAFAQIPDKIYGKPADFKLMKKRTVVVELLEEDPKRIEKLSKNAKKADELEEYKNRIAYINQCLRDFVPKYWKYNETIEFKTSSEVAILVKKKDRNVVVLSYYELKDLNMGFDPMSDTKMFVPVLKYTRPEQNPKMFDYMMYMPSAFVRKDNRYVEADFKAALLLMQKNIEYNASNPKALNFIEYAELMKEQNCKNLSDLKLHVQKDLLFKKTTQEDVNSNYGNDVELLFEQDFSEQFVKGEQGTAFAFSVPYGLMKSSSSVGPLQLNNANIVYCKLVLDASTCDVMTILLVGMGKSYVSEYIKGDFKRMRDCKK